MFENAAFIGSLGVGILLIVFFLNLFKIISQNDLIYLIPNIIGGALACYSSIVIGFIPFIILEGTWSIVALAGTIRVLIKPKARK